jgi:hypothetical protein
MVHHLQIMSFVVKRGGSILIACCLVYKISCLVVSVPGLEIRYYGRRGSAALIMRHPSIRKSWK